MVVVLLVLGAARGADPAPRSTPAARAAFSAAAALQNRGAWDLAAGAWRALLRDHPTDPLAARARGHLGTCLAEQGLRAEAVAELRAAVELAGDDPGTAAAARYELGRTLFAAARESGTADDHRAAAAAFEAFLAALPEGGGEAFAARAVDALALAAESRWQSGDRAGAVAAWEKFSREHAASARLPEVLYALGVAHAEDGEAAAAEEAFARLATAFPEHALADEVAVRRADLALAAGRPADAARLVVGIAKRDRADRRADALERLALALWRQERPAAAAAAYDLLAEARGGDVRAVVSAGDAWAAAGKREEAVARYERVIAGDDPRGRAGAAARLSALLLAAGDAPAALEAARRGGAPEDAGLAAATAAALAAIPGRGDEAIDVVRRLRRDHPLDPAAGGALVTEATVHLAAGRPAEARAAAEAFLALPEERRGAAFDGPAVRAILAESRLSGGDPAAAAADYRALLAEFASDPRRPRWRLRLGAALVAAEDWSAAHAELGPLAGAAAGASGLGKDDSADALLLDATALLEAGDARGAIPLLERVRAEHPSGTRSAEGVLLLARARRATGDAGAASGLLEALVAPDPPPAAVADRVWLRLGQARREGGDPAGAIAAYRESRRCGAPPARAATSLLAEGWCHDAIGDAAAAEGCFSEVVERLPDTPSFPEALLARADLRLRGGDPAAALADADRVAAVPGVPSDVEARARLVAGLAEFAAGAPDAAVGRFETLLAALPGFAEADRVRLELARALAAAGRDDDAAAALESLRVACPGSPRIAESWLETGEIRFAAGDWKGAAEAERAALSAAGPDDAAIREQALHRLAWTHAMSDDAAAAAAGFAEQVATFPDGDLAADGRVMLGDALVRLGRTDEALPALVAALAAPAMVSSPDLLGLATVRTAECEGARGDAAASLARLDAWLREARGAGVSGRTLALGRFARASAFHALGRLDDALGEFRSLADGADEIAGTELAARARLMEGEMLFETERHAEAIAAFFKVAYGFGDREAPAAFAPWQAQATYEAARCCDVIGKPDQARSLYAELVERHPGSPLVEPSRRRLDALGPGR